jgi:hypothetical protein
MCAPSLEAALPEQHVISDRTYEICDVRLVRHRQTVRREMAFLTKFENEMRTANYFNPSLNSIRTMLRVRWYSVFANLQM